MGSDRAPSMAAQRNAILVLLLLLAGIAWAWLVWQASDSIMDAAMASPTMSMPGPLFLLIWVVMMVAMMFPTAAPMILMFHKVQSGKRQRQESFVATWIFVGGYLLVWTVAGIAAYGGAVLAEVAAARAGLSSETAARIGGGVLILAGLYQLTPLKDRCLSKCRTPVSFIMTSWRDGTYGALRMGVHHGAYCLGCCWLLFVILFPLGIMNIAAMVVITLIVFAEKTLPWRRGVERAVAVFLVAYGAVVFVAPRALPTFVGAGGMTMAVPDKPMDMRTMPMPDGMGGAGK